MSKREGYYQKRVEWCRAQIASLSRQIGRFTLFRVLIFALVVAGIWMSLSTESALGVVMSVIAAAGFVYVVKRHIGLTSERNLVQKRLWIVESELAGLDRSELRWASGDKYREGDHPFCEDLDVFGVGSLFQILNRTGLEEGSQRLSATLKYPLLEKKEILRRQAAILELSEKTEWREELLAHSLVNTEAGFDGSKIVEWSNQPEKNRLSRATPVLFFAVPIIQGLNTLAFVQDIYGSSLFALIFLTPLIVASLRITKTNREYSELGVSVKHLKHISSLFMHMNGEEFDNEDLRLIQNNTRQGAEALKKLNRVAEAFDARANFVLSLFGNIYFSWEFYCAWKLQGWRTAYSSEIKQWLNGLAEIEMLNSYAAFKFNAEESVVPEIVDESTALDASDLKHPAMVPGNCVGNSMKLEDGHLSIITGANMAGKSTFLRTVGVSLILAMNGSDVLASSFKFFPCQIFSSMRTSDSLVNNESYFFNELKRLHQLVERLAKGEKLVVILDEILKGTNSVDKAEGSFKFVEKLLNYNVSGMIATHDLSLCELQEQYPENIENLFFDVEVLDDDLSFDYTLRKGVCSNMNATFLMKKMNIID